ncbi:MAG: type II toxin-antitoxin system HicA family toxin [Defluviitaleaceae bacterium]|nr:type II toxin-antitoxin system HicA family toxin [Defluviitaleaceae bacterium]
MKIPRDVNARDLIKVLEGYDYTFIRQEGSHIRMAKTFQKIAKEICVFNGLDINDFYGQL